MEYTEAQLENMSMDELRELAYSHGAITAEIEQPRDPQGRFTKVESELAEETEETQTEEEPELYRREIDLGDGSGKQVFEAETLEALVDKLAEAQRHATRKIRDLNRHVKEISPAPVPKPLTKDEEFVVSQQLQTEPSKAFELLFERHMGMPLAEFRQLSAETKQVNLEKANDNVAKAWVAAHPEYFANPANGQRMNAYIAKFFGGVNTPDNLDAAYSDLKTSGLLQDKPAAQATAQTTTRVVRRSSSLPVSRAAAPPPAKKGPTAEELENMPLDKLRELANGGRQFGGW